MKEETDKEKDEEPEEAEEPIEEQAGNFEITAYIRKPYPESVEEYMNTLRLKRKLFWGVDKEDAETQMEVLCTLWQKEKRKAEKQYKQMEEEIKQMKEKLAVLEQREKELEDREKQVKDKEEQLLLREKESEHREQGKAGEIQLQKRTILSWPNRLKNSMKIQRERGGKKRWKGELWEKR